jgi:methylthioribose-1-phosphate isomerase
MLINNKTYKTIWYDEVTNEVKIIDQTKLPFNLEIITLKNLNDVIKAINEMQVRGAPLIGATAAYGVYIAYRELKDKSKINEEAVKIKNTRPTAVNLFWALNKMLSKIDHKKPKSEIEKTLLNEANRICEDDIENCKNIGKNGLEIIKKIHDKKGHVNILTHCNAGWLATIDWGTATAPIYYAKKSNLNIHVWVDETRPRNQGASLTSYELNNENVENTIITDNAAGILMQRNKIDLCIVGADRVIVSGDVINKIGTFLKALVAKEFDIPFYVAIPLSTIDWETNYYKDVRIEERSGDELRKVTGLNKMNKINTVDIYPKESRVYNPAFDITPRKLVTKLITNKKIINPNMKDILSLKNESE